MSLQGLHLHWNSRTGKYRPSNRTVTSSASGLYSRLGPKGTTSKYWPYVCYNTCDVLARYLFSARRPTCTFSHRGTQKCLSGTEGSTQLVLLFINTPRYFTVSTYKSILWNLWIYSLGVSTCLTSLQHRLASIRIFCRVLLPCSCSNFAQNVNVNVII